MFGLILGAAVVLFIVGLLTAGGGVVIVVTNSEKNPEDCEKACTNWLALRNQRRALDAAVTSAKDALDAKSKQYNDVLKEIAILLAAAYAAFATGIGAFVANGLLSVAAVLTAYSIVLLGQLTTLQMDLTSATDGGKRAMDQEAEGLKLLNDKCTPEEVAICMQNP